MKQSFVNKNEFDVFNAFRVSHSNPSQIRNVCILAHVDHGKTTLSDHLISLNGLISPLSAGSVRFLDSREDEQTRLITMKSSCITLGYSSYVSNSHLPYYINLIDSPGHVDFSSEVSAAVYLSDGALLLVDSMEGVSSQTRQVASRAFQQKTKLLLVLNKVDKLFTDLKLSSEDVYLHLCTLLEQVNVMMQQLVIQDAMQACNNNTQFYYEDTVPRRARSHTKHHEFSIDETLEDSVQFSPEKGNVVFCSSTDGWGFTINVFAKIIASKLQLPNSVVPKLTKALWGSYYMNGKTFNISRKPTYTSQPVMAVQYIFSQLWKIYHETCCSFNKKLVQQMIIPLGLTLQLGHIESGSIMVKTIMSSWLPLGDNLLDAIILQLPSPIEAADYRLSHLCPGYKEYLQYSRQPLHTNSNTLLNQFQNNSQWISCHPMYHSLHTCGTSVTDDDTVIFIAKFLSADLKQLRLTGDKLSGQEQLSDFVALARVFSGYLSVSATLYISGTEFTQRHQLQSTEPKRVIAQKLFYLLGQDLVPTESVHAGDIIAMVLNDPLNSSDSNPVQSVQPNQEQQNLNSPTQLITSYEILEFLKLRQDSTNNQQQLSSVDRCITLSTRIGCPSFNTAYFLTSAAIVRVCIEPIDLRHEQQLLYGLAILYKSDPGVEVDISTTGEIILGCSGEVHLEKCVNDLQNLFARVPLKISSPVVSIRETLINDSNLSLSSSYPYESIPFPPWNSLSANVHLSSPFSHSKDNKSTDILPTLFSSSMTKDDVYGITANNMFAFHIKAEPIPGQVLQWLDTHSVQLENSCNQILLQKSSVQTITNSTTDYQDTFPIKTPSILQTLHIELTKLWKDTSMTDVKDKNAPVIGSHIIAPDSSFSTEEHTTPGVLIGVSLTHGSRTLLFWKNKTISPTNSNDCLDIPLYISEYLPAIIAGFKLTSHSGPICEEPVIGVAFVIDAVKIPQTLNNTIPIPDTPLKTHSENLLLNHSKQTDNSSKDIETIQRSSLHENRPFGPLSGQIISCVKDCCRRALLQRGKTRIYEAMHHLELLCEQEVIGKAYGVLAKRRARVISNALKEGSSVFCIEAFLPVEESFGLALDLRSKTSGQLSINLQFSHWEMIEEDPFPEACITEKDLENEGDSSYISTVSNTARRIIFSIRKRKGLSTDEKIIINATKQRTLTKNK